MLCFIKNDIIQGILLNVVLFVTPVFLRVGRVVCSHSYNLLKQHISVIYHV